MKMKICVTLLGVLLISQAAWANTISSSTMWFHENSGDELAAFYDVSSGYFGYTGTINMVNEATTTHDYIVQNSDGIAGFDVYAKEGATAWFGNDPDKGGPQPPDWLSQAIGADHDAWPDWNPDTPDWYQYSLDLYVEDGVSRWALRNHAGSTATDPWSTPARGVPMSGTLEWIGNGVAIARETDVGTYLPGMGTSEIPGGAASQGGGAGYWDMDWSWGSEVVPLEHSTFLLDVRPMSDTLGASLKPIPAPGAILLGSIGIGLVGYLRRRRSL